jgi:hypothetical protein
MVYDQLRNWFMITFVKEIFYDDGLNSRIEFGVKI